MDNTLIQQGYFVSDSTTKYISVRAGFDWVRVLNFTEYGATSANAGIEYLWQRTMPNGSAMVKYHNSDTTILSRLFDANEGGISFVDSSVNSPEAAKTGTTITKATPPVLTVTAHGYATGDIVRINSVTTGMQQLQGVDFSITRTGANTFTFTNIDTNTASFTAATAFTARRIPFDPIYYPRRRVITGFQAALVDTAQTLITMSVTHGFTVGQVVAVTIPSVWGITLPRTTGVITAIGEADDSSFTNTITVNIPASSWSGTFAWPAITSLPLTYAEVVPVGENVDATILDASGNPLNPNLLNGATRNTAALYLVLGTGDGTVTGPAGDTGDEIYWMAGKNYLI